MVKIIAILSMLLMVVSSCCRTHKIGLTLDTSLPLEMCKKEVDKSEIETRVIQVKRVKDVKLRFKKRLLWKIKQARSFCFIIPGRGLKTWVSLEIDTVKIQVRPNMICFKGKYYRSSLFKACMNYLNKFDDST